MANTFVDYTGADGTGTDNKDFAFSFPYLDDSHIVVQVDQASVSGGAFVTKTLTTDYTIVTSPSKLIRFVSAPASADRIRIKRDSASNTALVDFENGSVLTEVELDRAYLHNLYLNEEIEEGSGKNVMTKNSAGNFEADLAKIVDLADPTLAQDAATKNYVDTRGLQDFDGANTTSDVNLNSNKLTNVTDPGSNQDAATKNYVDTQDALQVTKAGDSMSGNLAMGGNDITGVNSVSDLIAPAAGSHATNKTYVDAGDADQVNKTGDSMTGALAMGDNKITGLATPTSTADATNKSYVDAQIATTLATGVAGGPIGTTNIADDAVTADKLAHTAVTPGFYTNTNITVDQQGRITAAATGSSGAPTANEILTSLKTVDGTGTGLDADLLDGLEATAFATTVSLGTAAYVSLGTFAPASHTHTAANITDFDTAVTTVVQSDASGATSAEYTPTVISRNNIDSDPTILQWGYTRVGRIIYLNIYVAWNGTGNLGLISSDVDASVKFSVPFLPESRFGSGNYGIIWKTELESILKTSDDVLSTSHFNKTSATVQNVSGTGQVTVNFFNSDTRYAWLVRGTIAYKLDNTVT